MRGIMGGVILPSPHSREKRAIRYEDVASALDAGIPLEAAVGHPGPTLCEALAATGVALTHVDRAVLAAAERSGDVSRALRDRATHERSIASLQRAIVARLAYPLFVLVCAAALTWFLRTRSLGGSDLPWIALLGIVVVTTGFAWMLHRAHRVVRLPTFLAPFRGVLRDYATIPYLDAMYAQYRAGIPILEAHSLAATAAPIGVTRAALLDAGQRLERTRDTLGRALEESGALDRETSDLLAKAELAGDLEDGLRRALERRRQTFERRLTFHARAFGGTVYSVAVFACAWQIVSFYENLLPGR
ncbi:MAG: type II secretion system F family protein [Planctomycetes bacterium]|nr:type II secretion system F family protein [Planctomycetota bacterium]